MNTKTTKTTRPATSIRTKTKITAARTGDIALTTAATISYAAIEMSRIAARATAYTVAYAKTTATAKWEENSDKTKRRSNASGQKATESVEALYDRLGF